MGMIFKILRLDAQWVSDLKSGKVSTEQALFEDKIPKENQLELEKSWHGLHFMFTGQPWPDPSSDVSAFIMSQHESIGNDLGFGPARLVDPETTEKINEFLTSKDENFVEQFLDIDQLSSNEIYPSIWDEDRSLLVKEYSTCFLELRQFVSEATKNNQALLLSMS